MSLNKLSLLDFQAHEKLRLNFTPGVNVIVAPTDSGKSAVIRALRWVARNKPGGEDFIRHGAKRAAVRLGFDDTRTVVRKRGGRNNSYVLDGNKSVAFGANVPTDVSEALRIEDINFQQQHDAPYWFGESDGRVAKQLNSIVNLSIIDNVMSGCRSKVHASRTMVEVCTERVRQSKDALNRAKSAVEQDADLVEVERHFEGLTTLRVRVELLTELIGLRNEARARLRALSAAVRDGSEVLLLGASLKEVSARSEALFSALRQAKQGREILSAGRPDLSAVNHAAVALREAQHIRRSLGDHIDNLRELYRERKSKEKALADAEEELKSNTPKTCPTCGGPFNHIHNANR